MGRLTGKTAIITGAARGIGAIMANKMAQEGANLVVTDVLNIENTVSQIKADGGNAIGLNVNVTSDDDLSSMVENTEKEFGSLNILINNASIFAALQPKPFLQIDNDEFDKVMTVNVRGVHQATKAAVPAMIRAGGGKDKSVEKVKGIHLYHGGISNCSMRVRMTLIEKGLDWTSHHFLLEDLLFFEILLKYFLLLM